MKVTKCFVVIFLFMFTSCLNKNNNSSNYGEELKQYHLNPKDGKTIVASSIFDSIKYITLPFNDNTVIASIDKLEIYDSCFYFWDKIGRKIYCFDYKGNYIFQLDKRGQGPGEYTEITDFIIEKELQQIHVLDRNLKKILCYDLRGNFIKDVKIEVSAMQFASVQSGWLLYTMGGPDYFIDKKNMDLIYI